VVPRRIPPLAAVAGLLLVAAACGAPPGLADRVRSPSASPAPSRASPTAPPLVVATPAMPTGAPPAAEPSGFAESPAVACAGRPGTSAVLAVLRRARLLSSSATATVSTGPMCAGTWQWSVVQVPGREPLQVVTKDTPDGLSLVTAGTDVCSIPVRTGAPAGIRAAACDALPPAY
jgi:hypothetical protein